MSRHCSPGSPGADAALDREEKCLRLRLGGATFAEIARVAGLPDKGSAHRSYKRAMARRAAEVAGLADEVRAIECARLDELLKAVWPLARANPPSLPAVDRVLRIMERRAAMLGLDVRPVERAEGEAASGVVFEISIFDDGRLVQQRRGNGHDSDDAPLTIDGAASRLN